VPTAPGRVARTGSSADSAPGASVVYRSAPYSLPQGDSRPLYESQAPRRRRGSGDAVPARLRRDDQERGAAATAPDREPVETHGHYSQPGARQTRRPTSEVDVALDRQPVGTAGCDAPAREGLRDLGRSLRFGVDSGRDR